MNDKQKVLLLIGSPRTENSSSESIGNYLCNRLDNQKFSISIAYTHRLFLREDKYEDLLNMINNSDLIILSFPLYVDQLPAPVIKIFEIIKKNKEKITKRSQKSFVTISNSGFPESSQSNLAIRICQNFANDIGFKWKGGLKFASGEIIHGRDLEELGKMTDNLKKGLEIAAKDLSTDKPISQEAIDLVAEKTMPQGMFKTFANLGWRLRAMKNWNFFNLKNTPNS